MCKDGPEVLQLQRNRPKNNEDAHSHTRVLCREAGSAEHQEKLMVAVIKVDLNFNYISSAHMDLKNE